MLLKETHIDLVIAGMVVKHNGEFHTVCPKDIKRDNFMGTTLFGDSYALGTKPVEVLVYVP